MWSGQVPSSLPRHPGVPSQKGTLEPWEEGSCQTFVSWNLGRRGLAKLLFLGTLTSRKVTKVYRAGYTLLLSSLDARLLDD